MNETERFLTIENKEEIIKKSPYRLIIYSFSDKTNLKIDSLDYALKTGEYLVTDGKRDVYISPEGDVTAIFVDDLVCYGDNYVFKDFDGVVESLIKTATAISKSFKCGKEKAVKSIADAICAVAECNLKPGKTGTLEAVKKKITASVGDKDFDLSAYLKTFQMNPYYLARLYKSKYRLSPHAYLTKQRLTKAKVILSGADRQNYSIKKVALLCGFDDSLYFSKMFKKNFGMTPKKYASMFEPKTGKKIPVGAVVEDDLT